MKYLFFLAELSLAELGCTIPPPLNGKSSCPKTLSGLGGYPHPRLNGKNLLSSFWKVPLYSSIWRLHLETIENPGILWFRLTSDPIHKNINRCSVQVFVLERSAVHVLCQLVVSVSVEASDGFALKYRRPSIQSMIWSWVESIFNKSIVSAWNTAACTPGHRWPCNPYKQKWPEKSRPQDKTTHDKGKKSRRDCHDL